MTTRVTVEPAGHRIEVSRMTTVGRLCSTVLEASAPAQDFYVWGDQYLVIQEISASDTQGGP